MQVLDLFNNSTLEKLTGALLEFSYEDWNLKPVLHIPKWDIIVKGDLQITEFINMFDMYSGKDFKLVVGNIVHEIIMLYRALDRPEPEHVCDSDLKQLLILSKINHKVDVNLVIITGKQPTLYFDSLGFHITGRGRIIEFIQLFDKYYNLTGGMLEVILTGCKTIVELQELKRKAVADVLAQGGKRGAKVTGSFQDAGVAIHKLLEDELLFSDAGVAIHKLLEDELLFSDAGKGKTVFMTTPMFNNEPFADWRVMNVGNNQLERAFLARKRKQDTKESEVNFNANEFLHEANVKLAEERKQLKAKVRELSNELNTKIHSNDPLNELRLARKASRNYASENQELKDSLVECQIKLLNAEKGKQSFSDDYERMRGDLVNRDNHINELRSELAETHNALEISRKSALERGNTKWCSAHTRDEYITSRDRKIDFIKAQLAATQLSSKINNDNFERAHRNNIELSESLKSTQTTRDHYQQKYYTLVEKINESEIRLKGE